MNGFLVAILIPPHRKEVVLKDKYENIKLALATLIMVTVVVSVCVGLYATRQCLNADYDNSVALMRAINEKDLEEVKRLYPLVKHRKYAPTRYIGRNSIAYGRSDWPPLLAAIKKDFSGAIRFMAETNSGIKKQAIGEYNYFLPLTYAIKERKNNAIKTLLEVGCEVTESSFKYAITNYDPSMVELLLEKQKKLPEKAFGYLFNPTDHREYDYSEHKIRQTQCVHVAKALFEKSSNAKQLANEKVMADVVKQKDLVLTKLFLDYAKITQSVLTAALESSNLDNITCLLESLENQKRESLINTTNQKGNALLAVCLRNKTLRPAILIKVLIQHGAKVNLQDDGGKTALHHAIMKKDFLAIQALHNAKADINIKDNDGVSPKEMLLDTIHKASKGKGLIPFTPTLMQQFDIK